MINIKQQFLPSPSQRRSGLKLDKVLYLVLHDTGNIGSTARGNANYYNQSAYEQQASAHFFVDDKEIIQVIPTNEKAWHVRYLVGIDKQMYGVSANDASLGIEFCYGGAIGSQASYNNYVDLISTLCKQFNLDPKTKLTAHATLDPERRTDPITGLKYVNKTWKDLIQDIDRIVNPPPPPEPPKTIDTPVNPVANCEKEKAIIQQLVQFIKNVLGWK